MNKTALRILSLILALSLVMAYAPALPAAQAAQPDTLSVANGNIEAIVSTKNGGFLVRTLAGDVITKDDDNKDLLYRNNGFDTSFTSFRVSDGGVTKDYIFGNDYSYLGLGGNNLTVTKTGTGIQAVWVVDGLTFTQLLEPVANESSNEHGTVKISYSVVNSRGSAISVKARLLLDTALGNQDYAYYELAKSSVGSDGYDRIEKERVLSQLKGDYLPANFFAYDNYQTPTMAAYSIDDLATNAVRPYQVAFGHWNNLAATRFDFTPDGDLTFTNPYNKAYLTADSAVAFYYDAGTIAAGGRSNVFSTYYGVDSKVRVKDSDRVGITVTSPLSLTLSWDKTLYLAADDDMDAGTFKITTNITNLAKNGATTLAKIAVAILVDDGLTPLDSGGGALVPAPDNKNPYTVELGDLSVGEVQTLDWKLDAKVLSDTGYRKIVFRAYDMSDPEDGLLVLDNLIGSSTTYVLCPGAETGLPSITFTGAEPRAIYNEGTRHIYLTGSGFDLLKATANYVLRAYLKSDRSRVYDIPATNIVSPDEPGVLDIVLTETMPVGEYELVFEWVTPPEGIANSLTAPALSFTVTADPAFRNNTYGVVAIVKTGSAPNFSYVIKSFADEKAFKAFAGEVLLVFRGDFSVTSEDADGSVQACSAVASGGQTVNINGALDFEHGNVQIYRGSSGSADYLMVEFDGDLYTTGSRTAVWSGKASITPLNDGVDYGLMKYDERGGHVFGQQPANTISLVWPSGFNMLQTIAGLAVDFRYGQFGAMYEPANADDDDYTKFTGYVVSFGGKLDLSFLMPGGPKQAQELDRADQDKSKADSTTSTEKDGSLYENTNGYKPSDEAKAEDEKNKVKPVGKVNIEDVLFGKNEGFLGFNSQVELMLPKYWAALPAMGGKLSINTIGGYAVGVLGKAKTKKFELEFELKVMNAPDSGTPVPDKIFFYMAGFEPGVNIDGAGAVWITGIGGGVDKLYDTIFANGGVPPLTLLLSAQFDIMKVMSGRSDLALSLRGFGLKISDVKLKNTEVVVIDSGQLVVEWDPDFLLYLTTYVELYEVIGGKAYLVVDDGFYELFLRASVKVPKDVDVVGGMTISDVDLAGNNDKIWGTLSALGIKLGITYYWGGDVHFGTGANTAKPTYPELLGVGDVPVGVNADTGETLYMRVGTNLSVAAEAETVADLHAPVLTLMAVAPTLKSEGIDKTVHQLNLGDGTGNDAALTITFKGDDRPKTVDEAKAAVAISKPGGTTYGLTFYDGTNPTTANANVVVDAAANTTTINVTITDYLAGDWDIVTSQAADLVLYSVAPMPEVTTFTASKNAGTGKLDLAWAGSQLDETKLSFFVTPDVGAGADAGEMGTLIGSIGGVDAAGMPRTPPSATGQSVSFALPADLPSGDYYVRMISSKEDEVGQTRVATGALGDFVLHHVNPDQPGAPGGVSLQNHGNNMFELNVSTAPTGSFDGYLVSILEDTAGGLVDTDFTNLTFAKDEAGDVPAMLLGGEYITTDGAAYGLTGGKDYVARAAAYKLNDGGTPEDPADDVLVVGAATDSNPVKLKVVSAPVITLVPAAGTYKTIPKTIATGAGTTTLPVTAFTTNDVEFALQSDVPVTGNWSIDGTLAQNLLDPKSTGINQVTNTRTVNVSQTLCDGEHTVSFSGTDADGDSFTFTKIIAVDTLPPRLMLTSPVNGSFFTEYGLLLIEGLADADALFTIDVDGEIRVEKRTLASLGAAPDEYGRFLYPLWYLDSGVSSHTVRITAADLAGNSTTATATVTNIGMARIQSIGILRDGWVVSNGNIDLSRTDNTTVNLRLYAQATSGNVFVINNENLVRWTAVAREGSATIEPDGTLTIRSGSVGFVEGSLRVADGAGMTGTMTFGAEVFSGGQHHLVLENTIGGTVTGDGVYLADAQVTLTATPASGYRFDGWSSTDVGNLSAPNATETIFTMPDKDAVVTARFSLISRQPSSRTEGQTYATQGSLVSIPLSPAFAANPSAVTASYTSGGREVIVSVSDVIDGNLVFVAPASATFYARQSLSEFSDTGDHWAKDAIDFAVARGLFTGVGDQLFDPNGQMTRAMFATVIARLDGVDLAQYANSDFTDVPADSWYSRSVRWAAEAGVVGGVGDGAFSPNTPVTREQMAVMLSNYLTHKGYTLQAAGESPDAFADGSSVNGWARAAVEEMRNLGIITGKPGDLADPQGRATRAECSTVFQRLIRAILAR